MSVTLQAALEQHQIADFNQIGTKHWTYLSYDRETGWNVVKFRGICGLFQQFFRWLGFYSSTHLQTIKAQIDREHDVPAELLAKIQSSWNRQMGIAPQAAAAVQNQHSWRIGNTVISMEAGDITRVDGVHAIVNAANQRCLGGAGIDGAIHRAAGPELLAECRQLPEVRPGVRCEIGGAVITGSGNLRQRGIEEIIHTVGPDMRQNPANGDELLANAYRNSLALAHEHRILTIAFPSISTGIYRFDFGRATQIAIQTIEEYVQEHPAAFNEVKLVFFNEQLWRDAVALRN